MGGISRTLLAASLCACSHAPPVAPQTVATAVTVHEMNWPGQSSTCHEARVAVQVLGSGGPIAEQDGRAASGYAIWVEGHARAIVGLGPGTLRAYGASGGMPPDLEVIALSHLHVDHSSDLVAFLKSASFSERAAPLPLIGPEGGDRFPATTEFVRHLLAPGGYAYLDGYLGEGQPFVLETRDVPAGGEVVDAFRGPHVRIRAMGVPHGPVPTLAFVVEAMGLRIAFMSDQRLDRPEFVEFIRDADVLIAHMAVSEDATGTAADLHAKPSRIGEVAAEADVGRLVLSHLMSRALGRLTANLDAIRERYHGTVDVADDGLCVVLRE